MVNHASLDTATVAHFMPGYKSRVRVKPDLGTSMVREYLETLSEKILHGQRMTKEATVSYSGDEQRGHEETERHTKSQGWPSTGPWNKCRKNKRNDRQVIAELKKLLLPSSRSPNNVAWLTDLFLHHQSYSEPGNDTSSISWLKNLLHHHSYSWAGNGTPSISWLNSNPNVNYTEPPNSLVGSMHHQHVNGCSEAGHAMRTTRYTIRTSTVEAEYAISSSADPTSTRTSTPPTS